MRTWQDIEARRKALGMSRAELCRRAGMAVSTIQKGLAAGSRPTPPLLAQIDMVLANAARENAA